jgi:predicted translin family RNA/ssDNA-binding protein
MNEFEINDYYENNDFMNEEKNQNLNNKNNNINQNHNNNNNNNNNNNSINKKTIFDLIKDKYNQENNEREIIIQKSREINSLSKKVIYSLHRNEINNLDNQILKLKQSTNELITNYSNSKNASSGSYKVAIQEYVEAMAYYHFIKDGKLFVIDIENKNNNIDIEHYMLGLCDLSGELVRKALNDGIKGNYSNVFKIQDFLSAIFNELAQIDFRNSELRKKVDSLRWDLRKLEEMAFSLKIKLSEKEN